MRAYEAIMPCRLRSGAADVFILRLRYAAARQYVCFSAALRPGHA